MGSRGWSGGVASEGITLYCRGGETTVLVPTAPPQGGHRLILEGRGRSAGRTIGGGCAGHETTTRRLTMHVQLVRAQAGEGGEQPGKETSTG